ncbi:hypothetical protein ACRAWD_09570 [Caulobacter segnis]
MLSGLDGPPLAEPRLLSFQAGRQPGLLGQERRGLGLGLRASWRPLESTSIHLIQAGIARSWRCCRPRRVRARRRAALQPADGGRFRERPRLSGAALPRHPARRTRPTGGTCGPWICLTGLAERLAIHRATGRIFREADELFTKTSWPGRAGHGRRPRSEARTRWPWPFRARQPPSGLGAIAEQARQAVARSARSTATSSPRTVLRGARLGVQASPPEPRLVR